ncbi:MAG: DUF4230 domain-containing protein [Novosphingobium aromaticivorans]|nr:DUF4230 domain-containing protein [Novosphingobium aromaticivorans]
MVDPVLTPAPAPDSARSPARSSLRQIVLPWFLFALALALAGFLGWRLLQPADAGDPLATSLVAFERQNSLTVFSAELAPVVSSDDSRLFGLVKAKQVAVIPARIDYTVDLAAVDRNRMRWDAATKTLTVRLPPLRLSRPNLDEARAQYLREGMWIGREAQDKLTRENTLMAERLAGQQAANPVLMGLARTAAKDAVRQNLAIPMQVAGFGGVTVTVTIDGESTG